MKLSPHFTLEELTDSQTAAREGIDNAPPPEVLERLKYTAMALESVRMILGAPIHISSGYRSPELNAAVKGSKSSQHMTGEAVDFTSPGFGSPREVMERIIKGGLFFDQCILEHTTRKGKPTGGGWVHMSFVASGSRQQALIIDDTGTGAFT